VWQCRLKGRQSEIERRASDRGLEGVFAQGHVYVLISRVTDPANFALVGLPPFDLLEDLARALREKGLDIDQVFERAVTCSSEFIYDPCRTGAYPAVVSSVNSSQSVGGAQDTRSTSEYVHRARAHTDASHE